jgi:hypothetical protein
MSPSHNWFAVDRSIWDYDLFAGGEPYSRREAWLWLISEAAWKPYKRRIHRKAFDLRRGQLVASLRFLAGEWGWSEPKVRRFLGLLKDQTLIDAATDAGVSVLTICNYDQYQFVSLDSDAASDAPRRTNDAATDAESDATTFDVPPCSNGQIQTDELLSDAATDAASDAPRDQKATQKRTIIQDTSSVTYVTGADAPSDPDKLLFEFGKKVLGPKAGGLIASLKRAKGGDIAAAMIALETAASKQNPAEYIGAIIRGPQSTAPTSQKEHKQQDWDNAYAKLKSANRAAEGRENGRTPVRVLSARRGK